MKKNHRAAKARGNGPEQPARLARGLGRRRLLASGAMLMGGAPFIHARAATDIEGELVFACDGGATQRTFEQEFVPAFSRRYGGIRISYVPGQPTDNLAKLRIQKNDPRIDVMWLAGAVTYVAADEGLVEELDRSRLPGFASMPESLATEKASAPIGLTPQAVIYNTDIFAKHGFARPTTWWDLWDPKYKGHVGAYSVNATAAVSLLAWVANQLTGDFRNLDAAFARIKELRSNMLEFFPSAGAYETAIQQGDCWIGMNGSPRAIPLRKSGVPIEFAVPREGAIGYLTSVGVVAKARNRNAAYAWVDFLMSTEGQERIQRTIGYRAVNRNVAIPDDVKGYFPPIDSIYIPDYRWFSTRLPQIVDRWNREVER